MAGIRDIDIRRLDATILMVFLGCMRHRKATAVAQEMGLTQPAVSHALKRLRALYGDPLFLRRAHGLEPTALAKELEPKIRNVVTLMSETLSMQDELDPARSIVDLRIGAFDYELTSVLPDLLAHLRSVSPGIAVHAYPLTNRDALDALADGRIEMAIGYFDFPAHSEDVFVVEDLFTERYVLAARRDHPLLTGTATLERFAQAEHMQVTPFGPAPTLVDHALQMKGHSRAIQTTVPSLFAALSIIEATDLVVTLPERVARGNASRFNFAFKPLPFDGGTFKLHIVRHMRDAENKLHKWLIGELLNVVNGAQDTRDEALSTD